MDSGGGDDWRAVRRNRMKTKEKERRRVNLLLSANLYGSGGLTPLSTPLQCACVAANMLERSPDTAAAGDGGIVCVGFQEAFAFKTGFLTYLIQAVIIVSGCMLRACERYITRHGGNDDDGDELDGMLLAPVRFAWRLLRTVYIFVAHLLVVGINAIALYPLNGWLRFRRGVPHLLCDCKPHIIARFADCCGVRWHAVGYDREATPDGSLSMPRGARNSRTTDGGLLLLANAAPDASGFTAYEQSNGAERLCNKGFLHAWFADDADADAAKDVDRPGVLVVNTHMQASDDPLRDLFGPKDAHRAQVAQLRAFLDRWRRGGVPLAGATTGCAREIFLLGDFNCSDGDWLEAQLGVRKVSGTQPTHADGCVDHAFYWHAARQERDAMAAAVDTRVTLEDSESDHKMLLCTPPRVVGGARRTDDARAGTEIVRPGPSQTFLALHALKCRLSFG